MDRLPSFAVNLDEDPTDIFGAICALLVCSALLKNCNNYLLDNKTFLWPCLHWKEYCDFWVNSSANSTKIKLARWDFMLYYIICWSPCFQLLQCILHSIFRTGAMSSNFPLLTTKDRRTTLPSLPGQRDTEERGYINASHHGGSSCRVTGSDGRFSLPSQSCANLESELSNYSPIEFTNACTTHNAKRWRQTGKHGYSKYTAEILLEILQKKAIHPLYNCRTPGFYGSLFLYTNSANDDLW